MHTTELEKAITHIKSYPIFKSKVAIILGSGLGSFADSLNNSVKISTDTIPNYPSSTVKGHEGQLVFGYLNSNPLIAVQGRTHFYEGYSLDRVTFIVRILYALDVEVLIITNAAGGLNPLFSPGDLMLIKNQINFLFDSPLRGLSTSEVSQSRDMSYPYASQYFTLVEKIALEKKVELKSGTLFVSSGPSYETSSEVKMAQKLGADAASMSTVPEVIVANKYGLEVIGISCITNMATGINQQPLSHDDVTTTANLVKTKFLDLTTGIIEQLYQY
jgi:purine-nucleoside phosphorylase